MKQNINNTIYVNPDVIQGDNVLGTSNIANVPMHTNISYEQNPYLTTNEFGQTVVNPDLPQVNQNPLTPAQQAQQAAQEAAQHIKDAINDIVNPPKDDTTPKKDLNTVIKDIKTLQSIKSSNNKPIIDNKNIVKPKKNYLLYGLLGLGALIIGYGLLKKE